MIYGYCHGKSKQEADRQAASIRKMYPNAKIYSDHGTTVLEDWKIFQYKYGPDTTFVFDTITAIPIKPNAIGGNPLMARYIFWMEQNTALKFIKEPYLDSDIYRNTSLPRSNSPIRPVLAKLIQLAYDEAQGRRTTAEKAVATKRAQQAADDTIRTIGRPYGTVRVSAREKMVRRYIREYCKDFGGSMTDVAIRKEIKEREGVDIPKTTYERYKKRLKEGVEPN